MNPFQQATAQSFHVRLSLQGASGSGKTYTALALAHHLRDRLEPDSRIAVIDTERGSALRYKTGTSCGCEQCQDQGVVFDYDHLSLTDFSVQNYVRAMKAAAANGYRVLVVDSLTHAWKWLLDYVEQLGRQKYRGNSFAAWAEGTPIQEQLVDMLLSFPGHIISTVRTKTEYVVEQNSKGKSTPRKVGLAGVQRADLEYEFDVVLELAEATARATKTRCRALDGVFFKHPGFALAGILADWAGTSPAPAEQPRASQQPPPAEAPSDEPEVTHTHSSDWPEWLNEQRVSFLSLPDGKGVNDLVDLVPWADDAARVFGADLGIPLWKAKQWQSYVAEKEAETLWAAVERGERDEVSAAYHEFARQHGLLKATFARAACFLRRWRKAVEVSR